jgi:hypothetical protein
VYQSICADSTGLVVTDGADLAISPEAVAASTQKIILGGRSGGTTELVGARHSFFQLALASERPGQDLCGRYRDLLVVYGKEKVYGSIP